MTVSAFRKLGLFGAGLLSSLAFAGAASATVKVTNIALAAPGGHNGTITFTPTNPDTVIRAAIGQLQLTTSTGDTLLSYCVDIFDEAKAGTFTATAVTGAVYDATKLSQINALITNGESKISDADHSAAMQLAIWEIVYDTTGSYDLASGKFFASNIDQDAIDIANSYLTKVSTNVWKADSSLQIAVLTESGNQSQLVWGANAAKVLGTVPEPATWAMMIVGFGAIGASLRRRKDVSHGVAILG